MKLGVLFSGGKDSTYAAYLAIKEGYEIACLITVFSSNKDSYMFHTPSITKTIKQAETMDIPILTRETTGIKEKELEDLKKVISTAIKEFKIEGIVTGAVESVYQSTRVQKICDSLGIDCFNPLWQKDQLKLLEEIVKNKFESVITSVSAYPLDDKWLGRKINKKFIMEMKKLELKYKINISGEGGEFESLVLNCPLFNKKLKIISREISSSDGNYRMEVEVDSDN